MSKVLQELISNVGSKVRERAKAMSLAFCIIGFSARWCQKKSVEYEMSVGM